MPLDTLKPLEPDNKQGNPVHLEKKLAQILEYWDMIKERWRKKKDEFWKSYDRNDFLKLLDYRYRHNEKIESEYKYLSDMTLEERKKFIEKYLHDDMIYSGKIEWSSDCARYSFEDVENWNVEIEEWAFLGATIGIWDDIRDERVKNIAKKFKPKVWLYISFNHCNFWDEWAIALSKIEMQEGITLNLWNNHIWDRWAREIIKNLKLKNWCKLYILWNNFSNDVKDELRRREKDNIAKWINCRVYVSSNK